MKALNYIPILALMALSSCTSRIYTGLEYDDLYYRKSDKPVVSARTQDMAQAQDQNLKARDYYDNIYAADTLVSEDYANAVNSSNPGNQTINYYDLDSYSGRLRSFYGNYFNPYWRDPYYYSWGYPSLSWGFGAYPYYDPFFYDPFNDYGYYGYYGSGYGYGYGLGHGYGYGFGYPYYGGYWGGYYGYSPYYSSWYSPYYNYSSHSDLGPVSYGRRERESNYSTSWNKSMTPAAAGSRRGNDIVRGSSLTPTERSASSSSVTNAASRRPQNTMSVQQNASRSNTSVSNYNSSGRTYTPSYNNPRMSTRPSYNTSRVNTEINNSRPSYSNSSGSGSTYSRGSVSPSQSRPSSSYNQGSYSLPSRRAVESGSGSYSSGRSSSPSYSSGGGESRSSYSSGSGFSGGSSGSSGGGGGESRSSSSGSSSGGRR